MNYTACFLTFRKARIIVFPLILAFFCCVQTVEASDSLHMAVLTTRLSVVKTLVLLGFDVNKQGMDDGDTPLHIACLFGYGDIVDYLIEKGSDINKVNSCGRTPFVFAAMGGHRDIIEKLIARGVDCTDPEIGGMALCAAVVSNKTHIVRLLLEKGLDLQSKGVHSRKPLCRAVDKQNIEIISLLLDYDIDPNVLARPSVYGNYKSILEAILGDRKSALELAYETGKPEILRLFTSRGIYKVERHDKDYTFDLHEKMRQALRDDDESRVEFLYESGVTGQDNMMLRYAVMHNQKGRVKELLEHGADPYYLDPEDFFSITTFDLAIVLDNSEIIKLFADHSDNIHDIFVRELQKALDCADEVDQSHIHKLVDLLHRNEKVKKMGEMGAKHPCITDECIEEHFHNLCTLAFMSNHHDLIRSLIWWVYRKKYFDWLVQFCNNGIDLAHYRNDAGLTILHHAIKTRHFDDQELYDLVMFVMNKGQRNNILFAQDPQGCFPVEYDERCERYPMIWEMFSQARCRVKNASSRHDYTYSAFEYAVLQNRQKVVKQLVEKFGANPFARTLSFSGETVFSHVLESDFYKEMMGALSGRLHNDNLLRDDVPLDEDEEASDNKKEFFERVRNLLLHKHGGKNYFQRLVQNKGVSYAAQIFVRLEEIIDKEDERKALFAELVHQKTRNGKTLLHDVAAAHYEKRDAPLVQKFVEKIIEYGKPCGENKCITAIRDTYGCLPVWYARESGNAEILSIFYDNKEMVPHPVKREKLNREERYDFLSWLLEKKEGMNCSNRVVKKLAYVTPRMSEDDLRALIHKAFHVVGKGQGGGGSNDDPQHLYLKFHQMVKEHGDIEQAIRICADILQKAGGFVEEHTASEQSTVAGQVSGEDQKALQITKTRSLLETLKSVTHVLGKGVGELGKFLGLVHDVNPGLVQGAAQKLLRKIDKRLRSLLEVEEDKRQRYTNKKCPPILSDHHLQKTLDQLRKDLQERMDPGKDTIVIAQVDLFPRCDEDKVNQSPISFNELALDSEQRRRMRAIMVFIPNHLEYPPDFFFRHFLLNGAKSKEAKLIAQALCDKYSYNFIMPTFKNLLELEFDDIRETLAPCIVFIPDFTELLAQGNLAFIFRDQVLLKRNFFREDRLIVVAGISDVQDVPESLKRLFNSFMDYFYKVDIHLPDEFERKDIVCRWVKKFDPSYSELIMPYVKATEGYTRDQVCDYIASQIGSDVSDVDPDSDSDDIC